MATNFPAGLDDFANYVDGETILEAATLNDMQFAIEALQAKVGIDGSAVSSSHDYILDNLFGAWTNLDSESAALAVDEIYKAGSCGFVSVTSSGGDQRPDFTVKTDSGSTPSVVRARCHDDDGNTVIPALVLVRKDDYWMVDDLSTFGNITIYWIGQPTMKMSTP